MNPLTDDFITGILVRSERSKKQIKYKEQLIMTTFNSSSVPPQGDVLESQVPEDQEGTELYDSPTPDGYDPHLIPAETAARKEREDGSFKHLDKHPDGSESIDTTGGFTVDKEGLIDNFGIEPEMYYETPCDVATEDVVREDS
jgi:hypothetical protein